MIHSMTAYARAESIADGLTVNMEIRSVNSRHLDLNVRLPSHYLGLEERIRSALVQRLTRGRIDIRVQIQDQEAESLAFKIDETRAQAYHEALDSIRQTFDIDTPVSLDAILAAGGIIKPVEHEPDLAACQPAVDACLAQAVADLVAMRETEGKFIAQDFNDRLAFVEKRARLSP